MLRAMRAEKSVGRPSASSNALVCSDCVPPSTAASASTVVRITLLYGSSAVSDTPEVWQCVRSMRDFSSFGSNCRMTRSHSSRAARSLAISMKKSMPMAKKNDSRPANLSTSRPRAVAVRTYSSPSAIVKASSWSAVAPASCMWYPEIEIEFHLGMWSDV